MLRAVLWLITALLIVDLAQPYILLTASLEDVHAIAKQLASSPVADQLKRIWRRASHQFRRHVAMADVYKRTDDRIDSGNEDQKMQNAPEVGDTSSDSDAKLVERRRADDMATLGKNASFYLSSVQKMVENIRKN